eukprot:TRINITY_DN47303_c0_g1_i1.p1 TRINITY_DN47303_c0_g1~~TRINITY_DN47303_c0_g1_i1.p1  ORF type:complete len:313 (-),score=44.87 TRINITY_DN47303_c0_g1_i1:228-1166(-)
MPHFSVISGGSSSALRILFRDGDMVKAESDALVSKTDSVALEASTDGGIFKGLMRSTFMKESFFFQVLRCTSTGRSISNDLVDTATDVTYFGEALVAASEQGEIMTLELDSAADPARFEESRPVRSVYVSRGAFLCSAGTVEIVSKMQGVGKAMFSGSGLFVMHCTGSGPLALACLGACVRYDLGPGEKRQVDNGHVVAWGENVQYEVGMAGSFFNSMASGEGLMCTFTGPGPVWVQTHKPPPPPSGNNGSGKSGQVQLQGPAACCVVVLVLLVFAMVFAFIIWDAMSNGGSSGSGSSFKKGRSSRRHHIEF